MTLPVLKLSSTHHISSLKKIDWKRVFFYLRTNPGSDALRNPWRPARPHVPLQTLSELTQFHSIEVQWGKGEARFGSALFQHFWKTRGMREWIIASYSLYHSSLSLNIVTVSGTCHTWVCQTTRRSCRRKRSQVGHLYGEASFYARARI